MATGTQNTVTSGKVSSWERVLLLLHVILLANSYNLPLVVARIYAWPPWTQVLSSM